MSEREQRDMAYAWCIPSFKVKYQNARTTEERAEVWNEWNNEEKRYYSSELCRSWNNSYRVLKVWNPISPWR
jgi:hypothetical protein